MICGQSGLTGNLRGQIIEGGDPFEGPRSNPFPLPPLEDTLNTTMFSAAAKKLGYHPFPNPSACVSRAGPTRTATRLPRVTTAVTAVNIRA